MVRLVLATEWGLAPGLSSLAAPQHRPDNCCVPVQQADGLANPRELGDEGF